MRQIKAIHFAVIPNSNNNAGDNFLYSLIRKIIEYFFRKKGFLVSWEIKSQWEISSVESIRKTNADFVLFGGGGLFLPDQKGAQNSNKTGWQINLPAEDYLGFNVPYFGAAIGFNWFRYSKVKKNIIKNSAQSFIQNSAAMGIRNKGSIKELESITGIKNKMSWLPCPTTLLKELIKSNIETCLKKELHSKVSLERPLLNKSKKLNIGINLSCDRLEQRGIQNKTFISLRESLFELKNQGHSLIYLAHKDLDLYAYEKLGKENLFKSKINISTFDPNNIVSTYLDFDILLGGRGHSLMIPFGIGIPIISLTTHNKQKYFMSDCNLLNFSLEITELSTEQLTNQLFHSIQNINMQNVNNHTYQKNGLNAWKNFANDIAYKIRK